MVNILATRRFPQHDQGIFRRNVQESRECERYSKSDIAELTWPEGSLSVLAAPPQRPAVKTFGEALVEIGKTSIIC